MIKNYLDFLSEKKEETHKNKFGCVMIYLDIPKWNNTISNIDKNDLYEPKGDSTYGIEMNPHVTALYGIHSNIPDQKITSIIDKYKYKDFNFGIKELGSFKNENFDVLKFTINPDDILLDFNRELSELPNSNEFPDYSPHITISYLNPGLSEKYNFIEIPEFKIKSIIYSKANGQELIYDTYA